MLRVLRNHTCIMLVVFAVLVPDVYGRELSARQKNDILNATVAVIVDAGQQNYYGTGTIIKTVGGKGYVMTDVGLFQHGEKYDNAIIVLYPGTDKEVLLAAVNVSLGEYIAIIEVKHGRLPKAVNGLFVKSKKSKQAEKIYTGLVADGAASNALMQQTAALGFGKAQRNQTSSDNRSASVQQLESLNTLGISPVGGVLLDEFGYIVGMIVGMPSKRDKPCEYIVDSAVLKEELQGTILVSQYMFDSGRGVYGVRVEAKTFDPFNALRDVQLQEIVTIGRSNKAKKKIAAKAIFTEEHGQYVAQIRHKEKKLPEGASREIVIFINRKKGEDKVLPLRATIKENKGFLAQYGQENVQAPNVEIGENIILTGENLPTQLKTIQLDGVVVESAVGRGGKLIYLQIRSKEQVKVHKEYWKHYLRNSAPPNLEVPQPDTVKVFDVDKGTFISDFILPGNSCTIAAGYDKLFACDMILNKLYGWSWENLANMQVMDMPKDKFIHSISIGAMVKSPLALTYWEMPEMVKEDQLASLRFDRWARTPRVLRFLDTVGWNVMAEAPLGRYMDGLWWQRSKLESSYCGSLYVMELRYADRYSRNVYCYAGLLGGYINSQLMVKKNDDLAPYPYYKLTLDEPELNKRPASILIGGALLSDYPYSNSGSPKADVIYGPVYHKGLYYRTLKDSSEISINTSTSHRPLFVFKDQQYLKSKKLFIVPQIGFIADAYEGTFRFYKNEDLIKAVTGENAPIIVDDLGIQEAKRGAPWQLQLKCNRSASDITYTLRQGPEDMSISETGLITWNVPSAFISPYITTEIELKEKNGGGEVLTLLVNLK